ncbi:MAG: Sir2 family NAD-dependent protein deacetylase [Thiotrichaceae bacterium]
MVLAQGISVESGIPPFRGAEGLWSRYDPIVLDLSYFLQHTEHAWRVIKELFYDFFGQAHPNAAHYAIAQLEQAGIVKTVITQNIDNLHQAAGSRSVYEYHGTLKSLVCLKCGKVYSAAEVDLNQPIPRCQVDNGVLKPNFIFFGEGIPEPIGSLSFQAAQQCDAIVIIGTTGEVMPACMIPYQAKKSGATVIEINIEPSRYTTLITDVFLQGTATEMMIALMTEVLALQTHSDSNYSHTAPV